MKVDSQMAADPAAVRPGTDLRTAIAEIRRYGCGFPPVVDADRRIVGGLTDREAALALGADDVRPSEHAVADAMTWCAKWPSGSQIPHVGRQQQRLVRRVAAIMSSTSSPSSVEFSA